MINSLNVRQIPQFANPTREVSQRAQDFIEEAKNKRESVIAHVDDITLPENNTYECYHPETICFYEINGERKVYLGINASSEYAHNLVKPPKVNWGTLDLDNPKSFSAELFYPIQEIVEPWKITTEIIPDQPILVRIIRPNKDKSESAPLYTEEFYQVIDTSNLACPLVIPVDPTNKEEYSQLNDEVPNIPGLKIHKSRFKGAFNLLKDIDKLQEHVAYTTGIIHLPEDLQEEFEKFTGGIYHKGKEAYTQLIRAMLVDKRLPREVINDLVWRSMHSIERIGRTARSIYLRPISQFFEVITPSQRYYLETRDLSHSISELLDEFFYTMETYNASVDQVIMERAAKIAFQPSQKALAA